MKTEILKKFKSFAIKNHDLISIKGGLCACKQAAPYSCEAGGYQPGTGGFYNCMVDIYGGCDAHDSSCHEL